MHGFTYFAHRCLACVVGKMWMMRAIMFNTVIETSLAVYGADDLPCYTVSWSSFPTKDFVQLVKLCSEKVLKTESLLSVNGRNFPLDQPKMLIFKTLFHTGIFLEINREVMWCSVGKIVSTSPMASYNILLADSKYFAKDIIWCPIANSKHFAKVVIWYHTGK